jgi:hypothetical protein
MRILSAATIAFLMNRVPAGFLLGTNRFQPSREAGFQRFRGAGRQVFLRTASLPPFYAVPILTLSPFSHPTRALVPYCRIATLLQGYRAFGQGCKPHSAGLHSNRAVSGLFSLPAPDKISVVTLDFDRARIKLKRIRPKKYAFKGAIIGPNPR